MLFGESLPFLSEWVMSHTETEDDRQSEIQSVKVTKIDRLGQIREKYIDIQEKKKVLQEMMQSPLVLTLTIPQVSPKIDSCSCFQSLKFYLSISVRPISVC